MNAMTPINPLTPKIRAIVEEKGKIPYGGIVRVTGGATYRKGDNGYDMAWIAANESHAMAATQMRHPYRWQITQEQANHSRAGRQKADEAREKILAFLAERGTATTDEIKENCVTLSSYENAIVSLRHSGQIRRTGTRGGRAVWGLAK